MGNRAFPIQSVDYENAHRPDLAIEVMRLSELFTRVEITHFGPQRPKFHLLLFVTEGSGVHLIDFCSHQCAWGTILYVRPGQIQQYSLQPTFDAIVVLFSSTFVLPENALEESSGYENLAELVLPGGALHTEGRNRDVVQDDFMRLLAEYGRANDTPLGSRLLQHLLSATLLRLATMSMVSSTGVDPFSAVSRLVSRFQRLLERDFRRTHRVVDFASRLGCSTKTLHVSCTKMRGAGPKFMIEQRLALEAQRMLVHTALSVDLSWWQRV